MMMHLHRAERIWLQFGLVILAFFIATLATFALVEGVVPPSRVQSIDPTKVATTAPFDHPGLHRVGDHAYEAYYVAQVFNFEPSQMNVPLGSRVTFYATSPDVVHGFSIPRTGVNMMVTPGWVSSISYTFRQRGEYLLLCNEYCGALHHTMAGKITVQ